MEDRKFKVAILKESGRSYGNSKKEWVLPNLKYKIISIPESILCNVLNAFESKTSDLWTKKTFFEGKFLDLVYDRTITININNVKQSKDEAYNVNLFIESIKNLAAEAGVDYLTVFGPKVIVLTPEQYKRISKRK